ncbi:MAG: hypothetical protein AAF600_06235 [Bacteroidota bacterium]
MGLLIALIILLASSYVLKPYVVGRFSSNATTFNYGVFFRVAGTSTYIFYAYNFSGGGVDAWIYDNYAAEFASYFRRLDLSPFYDERLWRNGQFFYTNFVAYPAAIFMIFTFDSEFGTFLLFSTICFIGLSFLFLSFRNNYYYLNEKSVLIWLFFFPALWFWTSTIGKDAFMFLGMGIMCIGISNRRLNYAYILLGLFVLYAFRPPTAYVALIALGTFFVLNLKDNTLVKMFKVALGLGIIVVLANYLSDLWGIEEFSNEQIAQLQQGTLRHNAYGGGVLDEKRGGLTSIPRGIVDVLMRPFLWEVRNPLTFASSLEINSVLLLLLWKRKSVVTFIRSSLKNRLSTFVISFVLVYTITVGLFENNIGLIARHRTIIFPFLFLMAFSEDLKIKNAFVKLRRSQIYREKFLNANLTDFRKPSK